jgi:two-component system chemotaxis response regulator CheB
MRNKIKVLIIDDSALVRDILKKGLSADPGLEVIGVAPDVYVAREIIVRDKPDVLTLDIEMPRMDGLEFLRKLMPQYPIPIVVVSSLTQKGKAVTMQALELGAVDFVSKPVSDVARGMAEMMLELRTKIKLASTANVAHWKNRKIENVQISNFKKSLSESTDKVIAIGASTGGTEAIREVIEKLPPTVPGIVIVQHMPKLFTKTFADRLNEISMINVKEAEDGDKIVSGRALVAPGDYHMKVVRTGGYYYVKIIEGDKVNGHRPSVDVMMHSVAEYVGSNAIGIILTGMGSDGAKGLKAIKDAGAKTIGQDALSSVVYGMPKVAYELNAVDYQLPLNLIAGKLMTLIKS